MNVEILDIKLTRCSTKIEKNIQYFQNLEDFVISLIQLENAISVSFEFNV